MLLFNMIHENKSCFNHNLLSKYFSLAPADKKKPILFFQCFQTFSNIMVVVSLEVFRARSEVPCQNSSLQESIPSADRADDEIIAVTSQINLFFVLLK